jgi:hypothetical protein
MSGHPLSPGAAERAATERVLASKEREASLWFRALAEREPAQPEPAQPEPAQPEPAQREPSQ